MLDVSEDGMMATVRFIPAIKRIFDYGILALDRLLAPGYQNVRAVNAFCLKMLLYFRLVNDFKSFVSLWPPSDGGINRTVAIMSSSLTSSI